LACAALALALGACSSSAPQQHGLVVHGAGTSAATPHWAPHYRALAKRIARLKLPTGDSDRFHIHALLTIYDRGYLVTVPANVGIDHAASVESTLHTHDRTGIIHMEAAHRFPYTLGDFFTVWGVRFGAGTLGSLNDNGSNRVWVYVNGTLIADPTRHVLAKDDNVVIGYGTESSFPHTVSGSILKRVERGAKSLPCAAATPTRPATRCLAPKHPHLSA
jgi:hypothetical protein